MKTQLKKEGIDRLRSKGIKTDAILEYINNAGPEGRKFTSIIKFAYEYSYGKDSYNSKEHKGYWGNAFRKPSPFRDGHGHLMHYITKNELGKWIMRDGKLSKEANLYKPI